MVEDAAIGAKGALITDSSQLFLLTDMQKPVSLRLLRFLSMASGKDPWWSSPPPNLPSFPIPDQLAVSPELKTAPLLAGKKGRPGQEATLATPNARAMGKGTLCWEGLLITLHGHRTQDKLIGQLNFLPVKSH